MHKLMQQAFDTIRLFEKFLSFYDEIIDTQRFFFYIIFFIIILYYYYYFFILFIIICFICILFYFILFMSNYVRSILFCWDKHRDILQIWLHVCIKMRYCKKTRLRKKDTFRTT